MVQAPGFVRGINPKSKIENPQAPGFIRGVNRKSKIENLKSIDAPYNYLLILTILFLKTIVGRCSDAAPQLNLNATTA